MVNRCNLCKVNEKLVDHILIHCDKTKVSCVNGLWLEMGILVSVRNLLLEWKFKGLDKKRSIVLRMALICLFWWIWKEHDRRTLDDLDQRLKELFIKSLLEWSHVSFEGVVYIWCLYCDVLCILSIYKECAPSFLHFLVHTFVVY